MKARALRGVCIGVDRHLMPGDIEDMSEQMFSFLASIGAVELAEDELQADVSATAKAPARAALKEKSHAV